MIWDPETLTSVWLSCDCCQEVLRKQRADAGRDGASLQSLAFTCDGLFLFESSFLVCKMELTPYKAVVTIPSYRVWHKHDNKMENVTLLIARTRTLFMEETTSAKEMCQ